MKIKEANTQVPRRFQFSMRSALLFMTWLCAMFFLFWYVTLCLNVILLGILTLALWSGLRTLDSQRPAADRRAYACLTAFCLAVLVAVPGGYVVYGKKFELFEPEVNRQTAAFQRELGADDRFSDIHTYYLLSSRRLYVDGTVGNSQDREDLLKLVAKYERRLPLVIGYVLVIDQENPEIAN